MQHHRHEVKHPSLRIHPSHYALRRYNIPDYSPMLPASQYNGAKEGLGKEEPWPAARAESTAGADGVVQAASGAMSGTSKTSRPRGLRNTLWGALGSVWDTFACPDGV